MKKRPARRGVCFSKPGLWVPSCIVLTAVIPKLGQAGATKGPGDRMDWTDGGGREPSDSVWGAMVG